MLRSLLGKTKEDRNTRIMILILIFFVGCITGWMYEEIFYFFTENWIGNRGFLYGPYLPVYGFGAVLMALFLHRYKHNPLLVFIMGMFITGVLEYITGWGMWQIWHHRWWDYTGLFMNVDGFVCLRSVISFAVGGLVLIYVIEPIEEYIVQHMRHKEVKWICIIGIGVMIVDFIVTLLTRY